MKNTTLPLRVLLCVLLGCSSLAATGLPSGDTTVVNTFNFNSQVRSGIYQFPNDTAKRYEKIIMLYSMRCKNGQVSSGANPNVGCGEWDYNCYTYIVDSSQTDSMAASRGNYDISNFTGTSFPYTAVPQYNYIQDQQQEVLLLATTSEAAFNAGAGGVTLNKPLNGSSAIGRHQYLWTAAELTAAGLNAGDINAMAFDVTALGGNMNHLRVRMKSTTASTLSATTPVINGFQEVYYLSTGFTSTGLTRFQFHTPFNWNGVDNLIVEMLFDNPTPTTDNSVDGESSGAITSLINTAADNYIDVNGGTTTIDLPATIGTTISNKISIAFWVYGDPTKLPANTSIFEALDGASRRQLNLHLPWGDGSIYWDCGNDGTGYDRINKAATTVETEGNWNFWVVTKDATTGSMKIYLNGSLWHSGTGKVKPINIQTMKIARSVNNNYVYYGSIDDFSIWNTELSSTEIQTIMYRTIDASLPSYSNLVAWYSFDTVNGNIIPDQSPNGHNATQLNVIPRERRAPQLFKNFNLSTERPKTTFYRGQYITQVNTIPVLDSLIVPSSSVIEYTVVNGSLTVVDTNNYWAANGYVYTYNTAGVVIDSQQVAAADTLQITTLNYYNKYPARIELINFITPYGINLNMNGLIGKTWAFDVTDFAPVLKGSKYMAMEGGNTQEDNDITFVYYEGIPPRDVHSIQNIWPNGSRAEVNSTQILNNTVFEPRDIQLSPTSSMFKMRSQISGHGQEGEFIARSHTIRLNNSLNFTRSVWTECATNPIYPQGGTWVYDRAGWCPGASVVLKEWEITPNVTPGNIVNFEYSLPSAGNYGDSRYRINNQLVSYGPANFTNDASLHYVKSPTNYVEFERLNPICNNPVVAIRNTGSSTLTSVDITYGRLGGTMSTYTWTGNLAFMQSTEVTLPQPAWLSSSTNQFIAVVSNPNGQADQYGLNDTVITEFNYPNVFPQQFYVELKTNAYGYNTSYTLKNSQGITVVSRSGLASNTIYRDTVNLPADCYTILLNEADDDGLTWWANSAQGSGYFRIRSVFNNGIIKSYNSDFGDNIYTQFTVNYTLPVEEVEGRISNLLVAPNPAKDNADIYFKLDVAATAVIEVVNVLGQVMIQEQVYASEIQNRVPLDIGTLSEGVYYVVLRSGNNKLVEKLVVSKY